MLPSIACLALVAVALVPAALSDVPQTPFGLQVESSAACRFRTSWKQELLPMIVGRSSLIMPTEAAEAGFDIAFPQAGHYTLFCRDNKFRNFDESKLVVSCGEKGQLMTKFGPVDFDSLVCASREESSVHAGEVLRRNGTCHNGYTRIEIAFPSYTWIEVCHNEALSETIWAKNIIDGPNLDNAASTNRPSFKESIFFPDIDADGCYKTASQIEVVGKILNSSALASKYIVPGKNLFFSRGHLTPNGDGIPAEERLATFYFVNVNPQWQTINGGNWERFESALRSYAGRKQSVLTVYTGAWGVTTLKDAKGDDKEIWLGHDSNGNLLKVLPASRTIYKVVLDKEAGTGVAVVMINNPYEENFDPADVVCESICDQLSWVTWDTKDHMKGYTYCCKVEDFYSAKPEIPNPGKPALMY